jgi:transcriptional regulator with AAA-type ATPase domain
MASFAAGQYDRHDPASSRGRAMHQLGQETPPRPLGPAPRLRKASVRRIPARGVRPVLPAVPFIDRQHELGELRAALHTALAGSGRVVLLAGEPGIGKTRLASVLAAEAGARGVPVW